MISKKELNPRNFVPTEEQERNLTILLEKLNKIRTAYGVPMFITSGLRSLEDHKRVYLEKGIPEKDIPMGSKHLFGQAADIADSNHKFRNWLLLNLDLMEELDLYAESLESTPTWVHLQIVPSRSGKRFFKP